MLVIQSSLTLFGPVDCSPPGSSVCGILQARKLERVAIPSSRGSSQTRDRTWVSCTAGRFFIVWITREAPLECLPHAISFKALYVQLPYFIFTTTLYDYICTSLQQPCTMIISTLDMRKLKPREGIEFAWDHTTSQLWKLKLSWGSEAWEPILWTSRGETVRREMDTAWRRGQWGLALREGESVREQGRLFWGARSKPEAKARIMGMGARSLMCRAQPGRALPNTPLSFPEKVGW